MKEQLLIAACKRGESWACKEIYETYAPLMMSVCLRYVNNRETARDLLQEGFIKVYTKIHTYSGAGAFGGWVRRVFVTTALEYLRTTNALKLSVNMEESGIEPAYWDESALERITTDELMECVGRLPNGLKSVLTQREYVSNEVVSTTEKKSISGIQISLNGAVGIAYRLFDHWSLYAEPKIYYYFDTDQPPSTRTEHPFGFGVNGGIRYHF